MEVFINCLEKGLIGLLAVSLYLYLVCSVYPWFTMKLVWKGEKYTPRGMRKVVFEGGRGVVYKPAVQIRKYVSQYAVFLLDGSKYVRCRINPYIERMKYDVVSFDINNKLLDVVAVNEKILSRGDTRPVKLPTDTAYACIVVRRVDGTDVGEKKVMEYSKKGCGIFFGLTVATTAVMSWFLYDGLSTVFSSLFRRFESAAYGEVLLRAILYGAVTGALALLAYYLHTTKVINK